jgi:hypothetical protein
MSNKYSRKDFFRYESENRIKLDSTMLLPRKGNYPRLEARLK